MMMTTLLLTHVQQFRYAYSKISALTCGMQGPLN